MYVEIESNLIHVFALYPVRKAVNVCRRTPVNSARKRMPLVRTSTVDTAHAAVQVITSLMTQSNDKNIFVYLHVNTHYAVYANVVTHYTILLLLISSGICSCESNFSQESSTDPCDIARCTDVGDCYNGGTCSEDGNSCECMVGWTGTTCEEGKI